MCSSPDTSNFKAPALLLTAGFFHWVTLSSFNIVKEIQLNSLIIILVIPFFLLQFLSEFFIYQPLVKKTCHPCNHLARWLCWHHAGYGACMSQFLRWYPHFTDETAVTRSDKGPTQGWEVLEQVFRFRSVFHVCLQALFTFFTVWSLKKILSTHSN